jgi:hypothetical protein
VKGCIATVMKAAAKTAMNGTISLRIGRARALAP